MLDHPCPRHRLVGHILTALLSLVLLAAGALKVLATPPEGAPWVPTQTTLYSLAVIDLLLAVGLWLPRASTLSFVLTVGYFGGATATHLATNQSFGLQAGLIVFTLLAAYFKAPELFFRLLGKESAGDACPLPKA